MSFGTTEGNVEGDVEYEPFIPRTPTEEQPAVDEPTAQQPTVEMRTGGPTEPPFPPPMPAAPAPAPRRHSTRRAAVLGGVAGAAIAALVVGGVAVSRDNGSGSTPAAAPATSAAPSNNSSNGGNASAGSGSAAPTSAPAAAPSAPSGVAPTLDIRSVLRKVEPSVVAIETNLVSPNGGLFGQGAGTGVIISPDGLVLTNNHVIEQAGTIKVKLSDGRELSADLVGTSPADDVALIKIRNVSGLTAADLGSSASLQVGDPVVAIGNALDLDGTPTVTEGIVSALGRSISTQNESGATENLTDLIQTDAAINPGNSGGPLVNTQGQVVGIDTAIAGDAQNIGFAIAIDSIKPLITDLQNGKGNATTPTAFLGVSTESVSDLQQATKDQLNITADAGAVVVNVTPGTAADDLGLQQGDVITSVDGKAITSSDDLGSAIRGHKPGDQVKIEYQRNGETKSGTVTLGSRVAGN